MIFKEVAGESVVLLAKKFDWDSDGYTTVAELIQGRSNFARDSNAAHLSALLPQHYVRAEVKSLVPHTQATVTTVCSGGNNAGNAEEGVGGGAVRQVARRVGRTYGGAVRNGRSVKDGGKVGLVGEHVVLEWESSRRCGPFL